jgi:predicted O-methyltransferase YrrM
VTLESDPKHAEVARANFAQADLTGVVELRMDEARAVLPKLASEKGPPLDLIFFDADKARYTYFDWTLGLSGV